MERSKYILWDWNGTLLDDVDDCINCMNKMLKSRGIELLDYGRYRDIFTFPVIEYYQKAGFDFEKEPFKNLAVEFISLYRTLSEQSTLHRDVEFVLKKLSSMNYNQMILSAMEQKALYSQIDHHNINDYFVDILGLDNIHANSKIDNGKALLKRLQIEPNQCVMIGDTYHDYEVALSLGTACILINKGHQQLRNYTFHNHVKLVDSIDQVPDILETLNPLK